MSDLEYLIKPRPITEYHEDMGPVLWWCWEQPKPFVKISERAFDSGHNGRWLGEPPYVGTPNDLGHTVDITTTLSTSEPDGYERDVGSIKTSIGGWPGYHTHFTPLPPMPRAP